MPVSLLPALELLVIWSLETLSGEVLHKFPGYCYLICMQDSVEFESPTLTMAEHAAWSLSITVQSRYNGEEAGRSPGPEEAGNRRRFKNRAFQLDSNSAPGHNSLPPRVSAANPQQRGRVLRNTLSKIL